MAGKSLSTSEMGETDEDFGAAYETYSQPIYRYFYWRTQDEALSEDLTSGVFEKAWQSRGSFHGGSIRAWLYRIARNLLIDHWRAKKAINLEADDAIVSDATALDEATDAQLTAERLHQALGKLPSDMLAVVYMRFIEGRSAKEVAGIIGKSEENVRIIQYRALKRMKGYLDE